MEREYHAKRSVDGGAADKVGAGEYFEAPPHGTGHCDFKYWHHDKLEVP
jgi:hypothetical protein